MTPGADFYQQLKERYRHTGSDLEYGWTAKPSDLSRDLLEQTTQESPTQRITWDKIFQHPLVKNFDIQLQFDQCLEENGFVLLAGFELKDTSLGAIKELLGGYPECVPADPVKVCRDSIVELNATPIKVSEKSFFQIKASENFYASTQSLEPLLANKRPVYFISLNDDDENLEASGPVEPRNLFLIAAQKKFLPTVKIRFINSTKSPLDFYKIHNFEKRVFTFRVDAGKSTEDVAYKNLSWEVFQKSDTPLDQEKSLSGEIS